MESIRINLIICSIHDINRKIIFWDNNDTAQEKIAMVTIKEIEQTVSSLTSEELTKLCALLEEYDA